jgi:RNA recognition motif-containing protein
MTKKSAAQIRRMEKRAAERGDQYDAPVETVSTQMKLNVAKKLKETINDLESNSEGMNSRDKRASKRKAEAIASEQLGGDIKIADLLEWYDKQPKERKEKQEKKTKIGKSLSDEDKLKFDAFTVYQKSLSEIEADKGLNSKDRRSAKRKADAIACEHSKFSTIQELLDWYENNQDKKPAKKQKTSSDNDDSGAHSKKNNPYILFVGQIPFNSTADQIMKHFQHYMGKKVITDETMTIRIPNNADNEKLKSKGKDRPTKGFAFCEFKDPELMYECLKLHHTDMNGRRINVLRAAGGGKAKRAEKIKERKEEQDEYISTVVDKIIKEHISKGALKEGELDDGAILLCRRRNAAIVEAALSEYIEARGDRHLENPSSFFAKVMNRVTEEGVDAIKKQDKKPSSKRVTTRNQTDPKPASQSKFARTGVDMSASFTPQGDNEAGLSSIFPSMRRGRGRGRGAYMR